MNLEDRHSADPVGIGGDVPAVAVDPLEPRAPSAIHAGREAGEAAAEGETAFARGVIVWMEMMRSGKHDDETSRLDEEFGDVFRDAYKTKIKEKKVAVRDDGDNAAKMALHRLRKVGRKLLDNNNCNSLADVIRLNVGTQTDADKKADAGRRKGPGKKAGRAFRGAIVDADEGRTSFQAFVEALDELDLAQAFEENEVARKRFETALATLKGYMRKAVNWRSVVTGQLPK